MMLKRGDIQMIKSLIKRALESYAKASTTSCLMFIFHTPTAPRTLIND